jgi:hypothetical protein
MPEIVDRTGFARTGLLEQLRGEFESEAARHIPLGETIRLYRFEKDGA